MVATTPPALSPEHETLIVLSGISPAVAAGRGYRTIRHDDLADLRRLGFADYQCRPGLLIPIYDTAGGNGLYQLRPDTPRLDDDGDPIRYETQAGRSCRLSVHPDGQPLLADVHVPLVITEGDRKGDSAVTAAQATGRRLCVIALQGVWNWRLLDDWARVTLKTKDAHRDVYIAFDSDIVRKREVRQAMRALAAFLASLGGRVFIVYLPEGPNAEKVGLDDFLAAGHTLDDAFALAVPADPLNDRGDDTLRAELDELRAVNRALLALLESEATPAAKVAQAKLAVEVHSSRYEDLLSLPHIERQVHVSDETIGKILEYYSGDDGVFDKQPVTLRANPWTGEVTDQPHTYLQVVPRHERLSETLADMRNNIPPAFRKKERVPRPPKDDQAPTATIAAADIPPCPDDGVFDPAMHTEAVTVARCGGCGLPLAATTHDGHLLTLPGPKKSVVGTGQESAPLVSPILLSPEKIGCGDAPTAAVERYPAICVECGKQPPVKFHQRCQECILARLKPSARAVESAPLWATGGDG